MPKHYHPTQNENSVGPQKPSICWERDLNLLPYVGLR